ncbi:MAG: DUF4416 family protein [Nitrospirae bacterium]|nr:DUF4416 family protein [Nitrospirota bacterium]
MRKPDPHPAPVKLFIGMLSNEILLFDEVKPLLEEIYGPIDLESPVWPWEHTDYYEKEMGGGLKRKFIFFEKPADPASAADIKLKTIEIEGEYLNKDGGRRINLDPGFLDLARVSLFSTKDFSHKIYIGKGIYAEVTLIYSALDKGYHTFPFTFPDFKTKEYHGIFLKARESYKALMKKG